MSGPDFVGTLAGYDMVLAVTEEAINNQLKQLYWCCPDPVNHPKDYLVDHVMEILGEEVPNPFEPTQMIKGEALTAWIGPPTVKFDQNIVGASANQSLRFTIPIYAGWAELAINGTKGRLYFNDWKLAWVCEIGRRDIQKLEEEAMASKTKEKINSAIGNDAHGNNDPSNQLDSALFQVSSLFCLFQHTQIVNSFAIEVDSAWKEGGTMASFDDSLLDADCPLKKPVDPLPFGDHFTPKPENQALVQGFADHILKYYAGPDREHPKRRYILGYTIEQKPGTIAPESMFQPKSFVFTTSPHGTDKLSTLNFCMLDGSHDAARLASIAADRNNGIYPDSFLSKTKAATDTSGILVTSKDMFIRVFVERLIDAFTVKDNGLFSKHSRVDLFNQPILTRLLNFELPIATVDFGQCSISVTISATNMITAFYSSTLMEKSSDPATNWSPDAKREICITLAGNYRVNMNLKVTLPWDEGGDGWYDLPYNATFRLTSGADGKWTFVPNIASQVINVPKKDSEGHYPWKIDHHWKGFTVLSMKAADIIGDTTAVRFADQIASISISDKWADEINAALTTTAARVILPAGDVFDFYGLDSDVEGSIYTHLTYKSFTDGERHARA